MDDLILSCMCKIGGLPSQVQQAHAARTPTCWARRLCAPRRAAPRRAGATRARSQPARLTARARARTGPGAPRAAAPPSPAAGPAQRASWQIETAVGRSGRAAHRRRKRQASPTAAARSKRPRLSGRSGTARTTCRAAARSGAACRPRARRAAPPHRNPFGVLCGRSVRPQLCRLGQPGGSMQARLHAGVRQPPGELGCFSCSLAACALRCPACGAAARQVFLGAAPQQGPRSSTGSKETL